jgi:hypothetical protein
MTELLTVTAYIVVTLLVLWTLCAAIKLSSHEYKTNTGTMTSNQLLSIATIGITLVMICAGWTQPYDFATLAGFTVVLYVLQSLVNTRLPKETQDTVVPTDPPHLCKRRRSNF